MSRSSHGASNAANPARRRGRLAIATLAAGCLAVLVALVASAGAATTTHTTVVLGQTSTTPDPSCPELPCQAVGSVTGFQVSNGQTSLPFSVKTEGKITAWTLTLAQPTNKQRSFFNGFFGTPPEARLAILRRVPGTNPPRYNLRSQGAIKVLSPYLGQTVKFGASLKVTKGDIVGLTVPTWAPAFAQGQSSSNAWRASRAPASAPTQPTSAKASPRPSSAQEPPTAAATQQRGSSTQPRSPRAARPPTAGPAASPGPLGGAAALAIRLWNSLRARWPTASRISSSVQPISAPPRGGGAGEGRPRRGPPAGSRAAPPPWGRPS